MERLTEYHNGVAVIKDKSRLKDAMEKLAEYENTGLTPEKLLEIDKAYTQQAKELAEYKRAEEQGLLLRLPCKVGDTLYTNFRAQGWYLHSSKVPYEVKVAFIGVNGKQNFINVVYSSNGNMLKFEVSDIGKTIFLTKEEAEAKLEELRGEK